jgi:hypothetical protein
MTTQLWASGQRTRHVVFDLDHTIISPHPQGPVVFQNERYALRPGTEEMLGWLATQPDVQVSFMSAGTTARNESVLRQIRARLPIGEIRSARDISFRVLSKPDMTPRPGLTPAQIADPHLPISQRFMKDLRKIDPDIRRVLLVDDNVRFLKDWQGHTNHLGKTYEFHFNFEEVLHRPNDSKNFLPRTREEWARDHFRHHRVRSILEQALEDSARESTLFSKKAYEYSLEDPSKWIQRGLNRYQGVARSLCLPVELLPRLLLSVP